MGKRRRRRAEERELAYRARTKALADELALPDFWALPRRPVGPVLPGFQTETSFWRRDPRV
jgi:hypothetical protein